MNDSILNDRKNPPQTTETQNKRTVLSNWRMYAAAAGSSLAMATSVQADTIVASTPGINITSLDHAWTQSATFGVTSGPGRFRAFEGFGRVPTGSVQSIVRFSAKSGLRIQLASVGPSAYSPTRFRVKNYALGQSIKFGTGSKLSAGTAGVVRARTLNGTGRTVLVSNGANFLNPITSGFVGFKFTAGPQSGDIGWVKIKLTETPGAVATFQYQVLAAAYNTTPGDPIIAGATTWTSSVPEPGTLGLAVLALGAAGIANWRKRRKEASVPTA